MFIMSNFFYLIFNFIDKQRELELELNSESSTSTPLFSSEIRRARLTSTEDICFQQLGPYTLFFMFWLVSGPLEASDRSKSFLVS